MGDMGKTELVQAFFMVPLLALKHFLHKLLPSKKYPAQPKGGE